MVLINTPATESNVAQLNEQQAIAVDRALSEFNAGYQYFAVVGGGGTGKTFTAAYIIDELIQQAGGANSFIRGDVLCLAPTNQAKNILEESFQKSEFKGICSFMTLHQGLGLQPEHDDKGKMQFVNQKDITPVASAKIILIDEGSMVSKELVAALDIHISPQAKVIVLGDKYQLFPVGEKESPLLAKLSEKSICELTQIMRQSGDNPIAQVIACSRQAVINKVKSFDPRDQYSDTIIVSEENGVQKVGYWCYINGIEEALPQMLKAYHAAIKSGDWRKVKSIAWKNKTVNQTNQYIRTYLIDAAEQHDFALGDRIIAKSPIQREIVDETTGRTYKQILANTGSEFNVERAYPRKLVFDFKKKTTKYSFEYDTYYLICSNDKGGMYDFQVLTLAARIQFQKDSDAIRAVALKERGSQWFAYFKHQECIDNLNHAYCITAYCAQGSTYENVFINGDDLSSNNFDTESRNRSWYVGCSRAKHRLFIY